MAVNRQIGALALLLGGVVGGGCSAGEGGMQSGPQGNSSMVSSSMPADEGSTEATMSSSATEDSSGAKSGSPSGPTYYGAAKAIMDRKCANCHKKGDIAPFELDTYESIYSIRQVVKHSIVSESMPPWPPARDCQEYLHDRSLTLQEKETLLKWLDNDAPKGDPSEFSMDSKPVPTVEFNLTLEMPEPYTPRGLDDNRCFLIPWPGKKPQFQRAFEVEPGEPAMLHHLLVYKVPAVAAAAFHAIDAADVGPGYYCPGGPGPGIHPNGVELIGDWVPGQVEGELPDGVGIQYNPGDLLIMQHHYNTANTGKIPDRSKYRFRFVDKVRRPAIASLFFNPAWAVPGAMPILPGVKDTVHSYTFGVSEVLGTLAMRHIPGYALDKPLQLRMAGPHLHSIGSQAYIRIIRGGGAKECVVDVPKWDFDWQGLYLIKNKVILNPGDLIQLECHWDNTAENQPTLPDGSRPDPQFVTWGDRTQDEMCLMGLMVTAADDDSDSSKPDPDKPDPGKPNPNKLAPK